MSETKTQHIAHPAPEVYKPSHPVRIVTAASLFDGHDAAINIMRRLLQATGCEVIHLGHDRSVDEVVTTAIQEDAQAIAMTSYQGGHIEYFKYMHDLLKERGAGHIQIFGGGGGVILPTEINELMDYGITRIYSPEDGRKLGLQGMINDVVKLSDKPLPALEAGKLASGLDSGDRWDRERAIARLITLAENEADQHQALFDTIARASRDVPVLGVTGTGGAGKSSMVDELVRRHLAEFKDKKIGIISVDPTRQRTGGALLGDRIRMNAIHDARVYMRSLATRQRNAALSPAADRAVQILKAAGYDLIILETSGIGQSDTEIVGKANVSLYVMTPEYGAASQLEKIDMLDYADVVALNKFDKRGAADALRDVRKQYQRNRQLFDQDPSTMPVTGTIASQFNDPGTNHLYRQLMALLYKTKYPATNGEYQEMHYIIPPARSGYLAEIVENNKGYDQRAKEQSELAEKLYSLQNALKHLQETGEKQTEAIQKSILEIRLDPEVKTLLDDWGATAASYAAPEFHFKVREKTITIQTETESLSHTRIPRVAFPKFQSWGDRVRWLMQENVPGRFPYTAGIYPFKRSEEDPTRMFAGEGEPERTNRRFHFLSRGMPAKRLSTAFDSVTLYGQDPDYRPDIYGKVGNSGVSICCLDDMKKLYSGFNLSDPKTSVSMTINGPAPMILSYFLNAAIDQQCELYIRKEGLEKEVQQKIDKAYPDKSLRPHYEGSIPEGNDRLGLMLLGVTGDQVLPAEVYENIKANTLQNVRGTVQADILKEDQAQNTCIFSTEFALKLMGDVQEYFVNHRVRNFYSISVSGYHIAEAGANPITQLAFTLSNGFTYVEYFLSRGLRIDDFAPNLSFFFSNGLDPEYAVIGRVARRIWSKALRYRYGANARSQMLKYHIQTSGRSLHAREIAFNDIRTTLQALYAIYDNCNSLHTNAYDEAITTPTEESVRRALAIQLIINKELGLAKNENPLQGSFIIEELTDLVEEAVLIEFQRINDRGGVLGAMETMYQRGKIQEESLYYETLKHTGQFPIVGVNTFLNSDESSIQVPEQVTRATKDEKERQINTLKHLHQSKSEESQKNLSSLQQAAIQNKNIFETLMEACKDCSLGQLSGALFEVGGRYRRAM